MSNPSFTNGFASGSAAVSLRGLGVNSTLVLVNGRRMTTYGLADDGSRTFVDLNSIPAGAGRARRSPEGRRLGDLRRGRRRRRGQRHPAQELHTARSVGGTYGQTQHSDGEAARAFGTFGFGNIDTDKYNVFVSVESVEARRTSGPRTAASSARPTCGLWISGTSRTAHRGSGSASTTPSTTSPCGVTRTPPAAPARASTSSRAIPRSSTPTRACAATTGSSEQEIQPRDRAVQHLHARHPAGLRRTLQGYLELGYFKTKTKANGTLGGNNDGGVFNPADPANLIVHGLMTLPAGHPDNTFGVDRTLGLRAERARRARPDDQERGLRARRAAFRERRAGWDYDVGAAYIKSRLENTNTGFIRLRRHAGLP